MAAGVSSVCRLKYRRISLRLPHIRGMFPLQARARVGMFQRAWVGVTPLVEVVDLPVLVEMMVFPSSSGG